MICFAETGKTPTQPMSETQIMLSIACVSIEVPTISCNLQNQINCDLKFCSTYVKIITNSMIQTEKIMLFQVSFAYTSLKELNGI
jgi:hypothetical protein